MVSVVSSESTVTITMPEIRARATAFIHEWRGERREAAERQSFWNDFLHIFGVSRRRCAVFEQVARRVTTGNIGFIDLLWPGYLAVEHKSAGEDLDAAMAQLLDYLPSVPQESLPRLAVVCDFQTFLVHNLDDGTYSRFKLNDLHAHLDTFTFFAGYNARRGFESEEEVNLAATALLARLHDSLGESGYHGHALRVLMTRLLFILFADDTQVWERGLFHDYIAARTRSDGGDLGSALAIIFQVLNTPHNLRQRTLGDELKAFAYINGGIFEEVLPIASFNQAMRSQLLMCCKFDWSAISPAIFGSLFQNVMVPSERRSLGAHYTTEQNILRTIEPLFLAALRAELDEAKSLPALKRFHDKLGSLRFLDPACGCGNFLVIAYREIRRLELEVLRRIRERESQTGQMSVDTSIDVRTSVGQFFGIEIEEFPARIAETAMYLMDHLANLDLSREMGVYYVRFPIEDTAHVHIDNALRVDWADVLAPAQCNYVFGNPPFLGKKERSAVQREDMELVMGRRGGTGILDYVTAWYYKVAGYIERAPHVRAAFVSTNSITQGEQPPVLWTKVDPNKLRIFFAHRTFEWTSEARGRAHVHCVIVGLRSGYADNATDKIIFDYESLRAEPVPRKVRNINPYLVDAPNVLVTKRRRPLLSDIELAKEGSKLGDWGFLSLTSEDIDEARSDPSAAKYVRRLLGADEFLNGIERWCLWLKDADPRDIRSSGFLRNRLTRVAEKRRESGKESTRLMADRPGEFLELRQPSSTYLFIPCVSSSRRTYIPMGLMSEDVVLRTASFAVESPSTLTIGQLHSSMFMAWVRTVGGRIKSDFQLSPGMVYNTFPFAEPTATQASAISEAAERMLEVRAKYTDYTLADIYDPVAMPGDLRTAHEDLDAAVARSFSRKRMKTDADRLAVLFERYVSLL